MYNKVLSLLLIFSLAFNLAFVGIWVYSLKAEPETSRRGVGPERAPWTELGLGADQRKRMGEEWQRLRDEVGELKKELDRQQERLLDLMAAERPDRNAIQDCQQRIGEIQHEMRRLVTDHMMQTGQMLTPEQKQRWYGMLKGLREAPGGRGRRDAAPLLRRDGRQTRPAQPREPAERPGNR